MGIAIELKKQSPVATRITVERGRAAVFGGGPVGVEGDAILTNASGNPNVYADLSYRITEAGTLKAWTFHETDTASLPYNIGSVKLVILRESGSDYVIVDVAEQTRNITSAGVWEFPCDIAVLRNDIVAVWLPTASMDISGNTDLDQPTNTNLLLQFLNVPTVAKNDNLGAADVVTGGVTYHFAVRSEIEASTQQAVDTAWEASDVNDDAFSYYQFVLNTDVFAETNVLGPVTNLFDNLTNTSASVATGLVINNNIYYYLDIGAQGALVPVERFVIHIDAAIPAGGIIRVYGSTDVSQSGTIDLAKAQAVTPWELIKEFDDTMNTVAYKPGAVYHVAKKYKWVRVEIVGATAAATLLASFEAQVMDNKVTDGDLSPHPDAALKNRYFFDEDSFTQAPSISALITKTVLSNSTEIFCENAAAEFFTQLQFDGYVYLRRDVAKGSKDVMIRRTIQSVDAGLKKIVIDSGPGENFQVGDFVDTEVWFFRFSGYDVSDNLFAVSNWAGGHSTHPDWVRTHTVYQTAGN